VSPFSILSLFGKVSPDEEKLHSVNCEIGQSFFLRYGSETMYQENLREDALRLKQKLHSLRYIADVLQVSKSVVHTWLHSSNERTRNHPHHTNEKVEKLRTIAVENPHLSVRGYQLFLRDVGIAVSHTTVHHWLRKVLGFSSRRTYSLLPARNQPHLQHKRIAFAQQLRDIDPRTVVAIDETSLYDTPHVKRCWAPKHKRVEVNVVRSGKRFTLLAAMSTTGVVQQQLIPGSVNGKLFSQFIQTMPFPPGARYLLLDNVPFHHSTKVTDILSSRGIQPLYTCPYSPDYNPIELYFSWIKRKHVAGKNIFQRAQSLLSTTVPPAFCKKWFNHAWNFRYA